MKKGHLLPLLSLLMAASLLFSACTTTPQPTVQATVAKTEAVSSNPDVTASIAPVADGPMAPFPQEVVVNVMREYNSDIWFPDGETMDNNILTKFYKEKLNIVYKIKWKVERGRMAEQLDLAIASNDIPDIFEANQTQVYRLAKADQIQSLDDAYSKNASPNLRSSLEGNNKVFFQPATVDGKLYGLPEPNDYCEGIPEVFIRTDWLKKLNLQAPKTLDELTAVAEAFIKNDPDGNGQADTFGISLANDLGLTFSGLAHAFGLYPNQFQPDSTGKLAYQDIQPQMKPFLKKMNQMYKAGIFSQEFGVLDPDKMAEKVASGKVGIVIGPFWAPWWPIQASKVKDANADWWGYPVPVNPDGGYKVSAANSCYKWLVVNKNFKYPEAAIKGNNLWYELWRGEYASFYHGHNSTDYAKASENFKYYPPFWYDPPMKNLTLGKMYYDPWDKGEEVKFDDPEGQKVWSRMWQWRKGDHSDLYGWTQIAVFFSGFRVVEQVYGVDKVVFDSYQGPITDVISKKRPLADKARTEWMIKFIMGTEDVDTKFDTFVQEWLTVGGQDITDEVNKWYAQNKK